MVSFDLKYFIIFFERAPDCMIVDVRFREREEQSRTTILSVKYDLDDTISNIYILNFFYKEYVLFIENLKNSTNEDGGCSLSFDNFDSKISLGGKIWATSLKSWPRSIPQSASSSASSSASYSSE